MKAEEILDKLFELGADAQYNCWNPEGENDVEKYEILKRDAVENALSLLQEQKEEKEEEKGEEKESPCPYCKKELSFLEQAEKHCEGCGGTFIF